MGVTHSLDENQVARVSTALRDSAEAIQGINNKFDEIDDHWRTVQDFNSAISVKVQDTLESMQRLDSTVNSCVETVLDTIITSTDELTTALEATVKSIQKIDLQREMNQLPKAIIPLAIP